MNLNTYSYQYNILLHKITNQITHISAKNQLFKIIL